ncbi:MAG: hypothetical protein QM270_10930 [Bacillota bacterium]|nr:hypothetical protein [Bacillota bacterium]
MTTVSLYTVHHDFLVVELEGKVNIMDIHPELVQHPVADHAFPGIVLQILRLLIFDLFTGPDKDEALAGNPIRPSA